MTSTSEWQRVVAGPRRSVMFSIQLSNFVPFNDFFIGMKLGARSFHHGVPGAILRRRYRTHLHTGFLIA